MSLHLPEPVSVVDTESLLSEILMSIHEAISLQTVVELVSPKIADLLQAERVSIYRRDKKSGEMLSRFKASDKYQEIRLTSSITSIAGYCALSRQVINVEDVYDAQALSEIHPKLIFQGFFDRAYGFRTRAILVAPILFNGALLGVLQIINRRSGGKFTELDTSMVSQLAEALGEKVSQELQSTTGPYAHLVQAGVVTQSEIDSILERSLKDKQTVSYLLMHYMGIDADQIGKSLERFYQIPYMPYDPAIVIPDTLLSGIKESYLRTCGWLPLAGDRNEITILIDDPSDASKLHEVQRLMNARQYHFKIGLPEDMLRYLGQAEAAGPNGGVNSEAVGAAGAQPSAGTSADGTDAAAVQWVNRILMAARRERVSDVHIEPADGDGSTTVRFRVNGTCVVKEEFPGQQHGAVIARIKGLAKLDFLTPDKPQDGKLSILLEGIPLEFSVVTVPTLNGESMVLQSMTASPKLQKLDELNLEPHNHALLQRLLAKPHGLFLVVGTANSGKATSLHALLDRLNTSERTIWTVEDPIEITQKGLQQVQANPKGGFSFADALRSVLQCDPDIILVGDMRDQETANIGIDAALTGRMVFSSLHSSSATETLTRLMDLGVDKSSFADALLGVMSQRLVRRLCGNCKQSVPLTPKILGELKFLYGERFDEDCGAYLGGAGTLFRRGTCERCHGTGFFERMAIQELLVVSPELKRLILQGARLDQLSDAAGRAGMRTLIQDQIVKALQGHLDLDEVRGEL